LEYVQVKLVRILEVEEKILLKRDVGRLPTNTENRWERGRSILLALLLQQDNGVRHYRSWVEISRDTFDGGTRAEHTAEYMAAMMSNEQVDPAVKDPASATLLPLWYALEELRDTVLFHEDEVWLWVLFVLLKVKVNHLLATQLGLPIVVKDVTIKHMKRELTWEERQAPEMALSTVSIFPKTSIMTEFMQHGVGLWMGWWDSGTVEPRLFIHPYGHGLLGTRGIVPVPVVLEHTNDGPYRVSVKKIVLGEGPDPLTALLETQVLVPASQWPHWIEDHAEPGTPTIDVSMFEAVLVDNPMLGPARDLVDTLTALGTLDVP
jgi:hypothetical protein